jgi:hypothetical protein
MRRPCKLGKKNCELEIKYTLITTYALSIDSVHTFFAPKRHNSSHVSKDWVPIAMQRKINSYDMIGQMSRTDHFHHKKTRRSTFVGIELKLYNEYTSIATYTPPNDSTRTLFMLETRKSLRIG